MRTLAFLLVPNFALLAYAAAVEPLRAANVLSGKSLYRWWHVTPNDVAGRSSSGVEIPPDADMRADSERPDILFVCAGGNPATFRHRATLAWLRRIARHGVTMGGISGGPYVLARAGLLDGYRSTVHWEHAPSFAEEFPEIELTNALFEFDRDRITCSGGASALDMMMALIAHDHGADLAAAVGDWFIQPRAREGARPQRMDPRDRHGIKDERLLAVIRAMEANLETPHDRAELSRIAGMSLRQLERAFRAALGRGLHEHYLSLRTARARQLLRETSMPILDVALATGFGSASQFARAFRKLHGMSAREARRRR